MISVTIAIALLLGVCFLGVRIGIATLLVGFVGFALERGIGAAMQMSGQRVLDDAMNYNLSVIPLFVLMGVFIFHADVSTELYEAAHRRLRGLRGGLAHSTILACAAFSAVCGSSLATAATMTKVAMPPMRRFRYGEELAAGSIAAGGTLGIMIPPSVPLLIYGIIAEQDIGALFLAGILPGLLLVALFLLTISIWVWLRPRSAPVEEEVTAAARRTTGAVLPVLALFVVVLGGIYANLFTATEAAGVGAVGAALIALVRGKLRRLSEWFDVLVEAAQTTAALFLVIFGALVFAEYANYMGLPYAIVDWVDALQLTPLGLVLVIVAIAIVMGMFFESIGILLLLVPVFLPALLQADVNMIWFGIIVVLVTELGLITPPVGMNVFVVKSVARDGNLVAMFSGVLPFVGAMLAALALILAFPSIATLLPRIVAGG